MKNFLTDALSILSEVKKSAPLNGAMGSVTGGGMPRDRAFTEDSHQSYGSRVVGSIIGVLLGLALFFGSFIFLWKNEGYAVERVKKELYISQYAIQVSPSPIDRNNDNKLIAVTGGVSTENTLTDGPLSVQNALILKRTVEMYQWKEYTSEKTEKKLGGGTTTKTSYYYRKVWSDKPINSSRFRGYEHTNPPMPVQSDQEVASFASMGDFNITQTQIAEIGSFVKIKELPENPDYTLGDGFYYTKGGDPASPQIGDVKISYQFVPSGTSVSFIGKQTKNDRIKSYGSIYLQYDGKMTKEQMLVRFKQVNFLKTYGFRLLGAFLMWLGMNLILSPLSTILSFFPFLENIFSFISGTVTLLLAACLSCITIAAAWMAYRPVFAGCIGGGALIITALIWYALPEKKETTSEKRQTPPPPPRSRTTPPPPPPQPLRQDKEASLDVITR